MKDNNMGKYLTNLLDNLYLKKIFKLSLVGASIVILFTLVFYQYDHTHFNGFNEKDDKELKILNRIYYTMTTFSSTGYGDISPRSIDIKIITMILQFTLVIAMLGGILEFN